jgi:DNA-binding NarL/FixJ family response regulator
MGEIRLVLADDQRLFADNLKIVLEARTDDIRVLGIAYGGDEAIAMTEELRPEILLLDVRMPGTDGVQVARRVSTERPEVKIIMLTTFDDDLYVHQAMAYGAYGYILKNVSPADLIETVRAVHSGKRVIPQQPQSLLRAGAETARSDEEMRSLLGGLSAREMQIVKLIAMAYDNKQIAVRLGIAEQTVKNGLSAIYAKLDVTKRTQLMRFFEACRERGLLG